MGGTRLINNKQRAVITMQVRSVQNRALFILLCEILRVCMSV